MNRDEHVCAEIQSTLPLYVGGDLEVQALSEVRAHLAGCAPCAERALAARAARRELVAALRLESRPGPDLWAGVRAALADDGVLESATPAASFASATAGARPWWRSWGVVAAAAAVVLGFWIGARWNDSGAPADRGLEPAPTIVQQPRAPERVPVVPVALPGPAASGDLAAAPEAGGLRRLAPGERQLRDSAPLIDGAYLYGMPPQSGGAMQPVGLQRVGPNAPRW